MKSILLSICIFAGCLVLASSQCTEVATCASTMAKAITGGGSQTSLVGICKAYTDFIACTNAIKGCDALQGAIDTATAAYASQLKICETSSPACLDKITKCSTDNPAPTDNSKATMCMYIKKYKACMMGGDCEKQDLVKQTLDLIKTQEKNLECPSGAASVGMSLICLFLVLTVAFFRE